MSAYRQAGGAPDGAIAITIAPDHRRRNRLLAFAAGIGATLSLGLVGDAARAWLDPSRPWPKVDELLTQDRQPTPRRVNGDLVPGSMMRLEGPCEYRFAIESRGFRMPVRYTSCVLSDPLAEAVAEDEPVPITVDGTLGPDGFVASAVLARTPTCCFCSPEARKEQRRAAREARARGAAP
jgi:cytochrome c-type biogenesis protein CcmE